MLRLLLLLLVITVSFAPSLIPSPAFGWSEEEHSPEQIKFFETEIRPVLVQHCLKCHGGKGSSKGGLSVTSRVGLLEGGDTGPSVSLESPSDSVLLEAVKYESYEMPPSGKLPPAKIAALTKWVEMGLPWTPGDEIEHAESEEEDGPPQVNDETKKFRSFQPVARPKIPTVTDAEWVRTPIDAFVLKGLEKADLQPASRAAKTALLRRAYYDVVGLPPSPDEVQSFLDDDAPDAFERVVDQLLESPHYGERWGRHWLDLVRYAETNSYERDGGKPFVWRYRDYVIRSFNADKPYDQFITEQIAGDELEQVTSESIIATGYYRLGIWQDEPVDPEQELFEDLDDLVRTTGEVFLGLTLGCARCHDHKLDPIPQTDYYRMLAFFRNVKRFGIRSHESVLAASVRALGTAGQALCVKEHGRTSPPTHVLIRGNVHVEGDVVEPGFLSVLSPPEPQIVPPAKEIQSTGRRLALAKWLASRDNPLTARVMVNRIWHYHFGRGIVRSTSDFGFQGIAPTHPELLDWLASEFTDGGWRIKRLHKLIMLSNTYQMSSQPNEQALAKDPINNLMWRFDMRRLSAEEIRDSILAVNGSLNRNKMFGPSIYVTIPAAVLAGQSRPGAGWGNSPPEDRVRRSIYIHVKRSLVVPMMASFDGADTDASCPVRFVTTQPTQALGMLNSDFINEQADVYTKYLAEKAGNNVTDQVALGLRRIVQREPTAKEIERGIRLVNTLRKKYQLSPDAALKQFCVTALNLNEFMYLD